MILYVKRAGIPPFFIVCKEEQGCLISVFRQCVSLRLWLAPSLEKIQ